MADIVVPPRPWLVIRRSANCYLPDLVVSAADSTRGFSNSDLHRAAKASQQDFSLHIVGNVISLRAVTHAKAEQLLLAHGGLSDLHRQQELSDKHIVGAFLQIPRLADAMGRRGIRTALLASESGVSEGAIDHALGGGRVTGGIAAALHGVLKTSDTLLLKDFATSRIPANTPKASISISGTPFELEDLLLPLPEGAPRPWG